MPSNDIPNQYNLIGENTPIWLVLALLLVGLIGSVTTVQLLLPPDITMESLKSWLTHSNLKERTSEPPRPIIRTNELSADLSTATTSQNPRTETASSIIEKSTSGQKSSVELHEATPTRSSNSIDTPVTTESTATIVERNELAVDEPAVANVSEDAARAETIADFAELKAFETTTHTQIQSAANDDTARDCPPLFFVQFKRGGIHPVNPDLNENATKLHEWLSHHPDAKILIEGHADSSGPEELNLLISHRRAKAVSQLLVSTGITNEQMVTRAFGEYSPLKGHSPESERNCRVSLRVEGVHACPKVTSDGEIR